MKMIIGDGIRQNPCRYCVAANYDGRSHYPTAHRKECAACENMKKHKEYLQSQRKFSEGDIITSLDELLMQEWVMWHHKTKHIEIIKHTQLSTVLQCLKNGAFRKAIKKQIKENERN